MEVSGTAASETRLGGYRLRLLPGMWEVRWTEGTAAGIYDIRRLRNNPCTSSIKWLMQGLPVAHFGQRAWGAVDGPQSETSTALGTGDPGGRSRMRVDGRARAAGERRERRR